MKPTLHFFICSLLSLLPSSIQAQSHPQPHLLQIQIQNPPEWKAVEENVHAVLLSAATPLWKRFPDRMLPPISVECKGGPVVHFERKPDGQYQVQLNTGGQYWSQYIYQFSHEFCHIMCNFRQSDRSNLWFEESICELASIYSLRELATTWKTDAPYPNWREYAGALQSYSDDLIKQGQLPAGKTLPEWFSENQKSLSANPENRQANRKVSVALLDLFEKSPEHWEALQYLNLGDTGKPRSFKVYLSDWYFQCPAKHKEFVKTIATRLGVEI